MKEFRVPVSLQEWNDAGKEYLPGLLGLDFTSVDGDEVRARMALRKELFAWNGYLHAAAIVALADTACGYGTVSSLPEDAEGFTTLELKANYLGTAREGYVECVARPLHRGRTTQVWDAEVTAESTGKTIAHFRCTQMILRAKG